MSYVAGLMDEVEFMDTSRDEAAAHPVYGPYATFEEAEAVARTLSSDPREGVVMELRWKTPDMEHPDHCLCDDHFVGLSREDMQREMSLRIARSEDRMRERA